MKYNIIFLIIIILLSAFCSSGEFMKILKSIESSSKDNIDKNIKVFEDYSRKGLNVKESLLLLDAIPKCKIERNAKMAF